MGSYIRGGIKQTPTKTPTTTAAAAARRRRATKVVRAALKANLIL
jgi:hypothetical protein